MVKDGKMHRSIKWYGKSILYYTCNDFTSSTGTLIAIDKNAASTGGEVGETWFNRFDLSTESINGIDVPIFFSAMRAYQRNSFSSVKTFGYITTSW